SGAKYFNAQSESDLQQIYTNLATELVLRDERSEITVAFAALAAALLLGAACASLLWSARLPCLGCYRRDTTGRTGHAGGLTAPGRPGEGEVAAVVDRSPLAVW